jgi:ParB-like chromosome segregation protein Spo0J
MKTYEQHPLSALFPPMPDEEYASLFDDIDQNGLRDPIVVHQGKILDGWHRYSVCKELELDRIKMVEYEGNDPVAFVKSKNFHRRHLSASQRAMIIVSLSDPTRAGRPKTGNTAMTIEDEAQAAQVNEKTIKRARAASKGTQELQDAVIAGDMTVEDAAQLAKESPAKQREAVQKKEKPKKDKPKKARGDVVSAEAYKTLQEEYDNMMMNYEAMAAELSACDAVINSKEVHEMKKLHLEINTLKASRDQWMKKSSELTRQLNYAQNKLKKYENS